MFGIGKIFIVIPNEEGASSTQRIIVFTKIGEFVVRQAENQVVKI